MSEDKLPPIQGRVSAPLLRAQWRLVHLELQRLERSAADPAVRASAPHLATLLAMIVAEIETWR